MATNDDFRSCCAEARPITEGNMVAAEYVLEAIIPERVEMKSESPPTKTVAVKDNEKTMDQIPDQGMNFPDFHGRLIENRVAGNERKTTAGWPPVT